VLDNDIRFISNKSSISIEPELEKEKHKVDDAVTVDKKHNKNDIQGPEEENRQLQSTATTNSFF
jgi:hypothetical protein